MSMSKDYSGTAYLNDKMETRKTNPTEKGSNFHDAKKKNKHG